MLQSLNTKTVGYSGVGLLVLTAAADQPIRDAVVATITHPNPASISAAVGVIAAFALAYYGRPHTIADAPNA
jgi:ADP-ribosylglycohydrolase